jgi:hypothetical protein
MIFSSQSVRTIRKHLKKPKLTKVKYSGLNRRALSLMPAPQNSESSMVVFDHKADWNRLSIAIEAKQRSGCLIIQSEKSKSRSGMLIFRGRVLSCMYGSKKSGSYMFGDVAFEASAQDLKMPGKSVTFYELSDNLVTAAASLFHGMILPSETADAKRSFSESLAQLVESKLPGCLVITGEKEPTVCIAYIFAGKMIGLHCSKRGWLEPSEKAAKAYLAKNKNVRVQACMLPCKNIVEVLSHTFSPTGLDRSTWEPLSPTFPVPEVFFLRRFDELHLRPQLNVVQLDRFFPRRSGVPNLLKRLQRSSSINHAFAVCP